MCGLSKWDHREHVRHNAEVRFMGSCTAKGGKRLGALRYLSLIAVVCIYRSVATAHCFCDILLHSVAGKGMIYSRLGCKPVFQRIKFFPFEEGFKASCIVTAPGGNPVTDIIERVKAKKVRSHWRYKGVTTKKYRTV